MVFLRTNATLFLKNTRLFLFALLLLIGTAMFFGYRWWEARQLATVWALIPENAMLVVKSENPLQELKQWKADPPWQNMQTLPFFGRVQARLQTLQQLEGVNELLQNKQLFASLHLTSTQDFDYVFYLPLTAEQEKKRVQAVLSHFRQDRPYRTDTRNFGGLLITEFTHVPSGSRFSYIIHQDVLVGSFTSFLVEDVIRTIQKTSGIQKNPWMDLQEVHPEGKAKLQWYLNSRMMAGFLSAFLGNSQNNTGTMLGFSFQSARFDVNASSDAITLQGDIRAVTGKESMPYLATFARQSPQAISCLDLIPKRTAIMEHWSISDAQKWQADIAKYQQLDQSLKESWLKLREAGVQPEGWFDWMGNELTHLTLEPGQTRTDKLLLVQAKNVAQALRYLNAVSGKMKAHSSADNFAEKFGGTTIGRMNTSDFPAKVLGNQIGEVGECFYITYENYIVFASSIPGLKQWFEDVRKGEVWSRSERQKQILERMQPKAYYTYFVNTTRIWPLLRQNTTLSWRKLLQEHESLFKRYEWLSGQVWNNSGNQFPAQVQLHYSEGRTPADQRNKYILNVRTRLDTTVRSEPSVVRNHVDNSAEVLIQDVAKRMYLVNQKGQILWRKWLEKPIAGEVQQIDYLNNGKLQYLFATQRKLYLLDRNGQTVGNFPIEVPTAVPLQGASVIDYDGNRDYRFAVSDLTGNVFLYSKEGKLLEGWNPLRLGYRLQGPIRHLRIEDKDYLIALQLNGKVHLLNRRGQSYQGFPVDLRELISSPLFMGPQVAPQHSVLTALQ